MSADLPAPDPNDGPPDPPGLDAVLVPIHWTLRPQDDVVADIIREFEDGKPLAVICRQRWMPSRSELYRWMEADPEVLGRFARARGRWKLSVADDVIAIVDAATEETVNVAKLRAWGRLQLLARVENAARRIERRGGRPGDDGATFESGDKPQTRTQYRMVVLGVEPVAAKPDIPVEEPIDVEPIDVTPYPDPPAL